MNLIIDTLERSWIDRILITRVNLIQRVANMIPTLSEEKSGVTLIVASEQKSPFKALFKRLIF